MCRPVGPDREVAEELWVRWVRDIPERPAGISRFARWGLIGVIGALRATEYQNFPIFVYAQVRASRADLAGNEAENAHVPRAAHIRDQHAEESRRAIVPSEVGDTAIYSRGVNSCTQVIGLSKGCKPWPLQVALADYFEVLATGKMSSLCQIQIKNIDSRGNLRLFYLDASSITAEGQPPICVLLISIASCPLPIHGLRQPLRENNESGRKQRYGPLRAI